MGLDHAKGPKIPKKDMYGRPVQAGQEYDLTGKPMGYGMGQTSDPMGNLGSTLGQPTGPSNNMGSLSGKSGLMGKQGMDQVQFDANGQPINMIGKRLAKIVMRIFLVSVLIFLALFGGIFYFIYTLLSGPSSAAEEYLMSSPDVQAESAGFHYGAVNNDVADLVGNYKRDGESYPVWVHLEKSGETWVVKDFANQPPQDVIDSMNDSGDL